MPSKDLYLLAADFRKTRLWERLGESELFAVEMPDGEIGYVSVMGAMGEHLALAVYPGSIGLESYRLLWQSSDELSDTVRTEHMMSQDCVMCSFEQKTELRPRDLQEIKDYGLTFRGKQAYPFFQRFRPRYCPWYVEDVRDEERLRLGLLAGLEVARRLDGADVQQDLFHTPEPGASKSKLRFTEGAPFDREIPLLSSREDGPFSWSHIPLPEPVALAYASPRLTDDIALMRLRKQLKSGTWECRVFMHPDPVAEGKEDAEGIVQMPEHALYIPLVLLMVDHVDGTVVHFGMTAEDHDYSQKLLEVFVEGTRKAHMPAVVLVGDMRTHALLSGIADQLGIRLTQTVELPLLDEAEDELFRLAEAGGQADITAKLDGLLDSADPGTLPEGFRRQMADLLGRNILPAATEEKLRRFLVDKKEELSPSERMEMRSGKKAKQLVRESYIISVSLGKGCYRHIRIGAGATLSSLSSAILGAFGFNDDHAHAFFLDNRLWSDADCYYARGIENSKRTTKNYTLQVAGLCQGKLFKYLFDFGDEWVFQCKVLRVFEEDTGTPVIIRSAGYVSA